MKSFSTLRLDYDCAECAALTEVEVTMPDFGETVTTRFSCRECGQENVITVNLEPDERGKGKQ